MHNSADSACALPTVSNESGEQVLELINELDEKQSNLKLISVNSSNFSLKLNFCFPDFLELTLDTFEVSEESPNLDYDG
jgi:hypothetical protein